ncbi:MAG: hypothetical protein EOP21_04820, partial [Hyphomicrobiales bacterium]
AMTVKTDTVLVGQPEYYQALSTALPATPIDVIKDKAAFGYIDFNASLLSNPFVQAKFDFYNKTLYGQPVQSERWKRISQNVDAYLGELLGQLWVKKHFTPEAKERMLTLVTMVQAIFLHAVTNHLVDAVLALILMVGGVIGAQFGVRAGQRVSGEQLRLLLGLLILFVGLRFAVELTLRPGDLFTVRTLELGE